MGTEITYMIVEVFSKSQCRATTRCCINAFKINSKRMIMNITAESVIKIRTCNLCESGLYVNFAVSHGIRGVDFNVHRAGDVYHFWTRVIQMIRRS